MHVGKPTRVGGGGGIHPLCVHTAENKDWRLICHMSFLFNQFRVPSLSSDVCTVLNASNDYNAETFLNEVEQVMQSNDRMVSDDRIPYDQIIQKKKACPVKNTGNNLCFSLCIARYMYPHMSENELREQVQQNHASVSFDSTHSVSLTDVSKVEQHMAVKILVFHHRTTPSKNNMALSV